MDFQFAANELQEIYGELRQYEEFSRFATKILTIGSELRKLHRPSTYAGLTPDEVKKALPPKSDPNSKIPRPTPPPRGSGPVKLAINGGNA
jgi:hypothetical protein